jgi:hypothetical protein
MSLKGLATYMDGIRKEGLLCRVPLFRDHWLLDLIAPTRYNIYGRNNDLTTAFSDVQRFIRCALEFCL